MGSLCTCQQRTGNKAQTCACTTGHAASLYEAAAAGCVQCAREFLHEAGVYSGDLTALILAISQAHADVAALLLPLEKDLPDAEGKKPFDYALATNSPSIWALFPDKISGRLAATLREVHRSDCKCGHKAKDLFDAVTFGCLACCARFLRENGDTSAQEITALTQAASHDFLAGVRLLAQLPSERAGGNHTTALAFSAMHGFVSIVEELLSVDVSPCEAGDVSILYQIDCSEFPEISKMLLSYLEKESDSQGSQSSQSSQLSVSTPRFSHGPARCERQELEALEAQEQ